LVSDPSPEHAQNGQRVFHDVMYASEYMMGINNRAELCVYDKTTLTQALKALSHAEQDAPQPEVVESLRGTLGRSPELDALLTSPVVPTAKMLLTAVRRTLRTIASTHSEQMIQVVVPPWHE
jgi:hypothetical protein